MDMTFSTSNYFILLFSSPLNIVILYYTCNSFVSYIKQNNKKLKINQFSCY